MSKQNIINMKYFNINDKKNSILENAPFQDNKISENFNKMENLSKNIKESLLKKDTKNNIDSSIKFKKNK